MKNKSVFYLASTVLLISSPAFSQSWVKMMHDPNANFYDIQKEFNNYWSQPDKKEILEKMNIPENKKKAVGEADESEAPGWMQFKRWEWLNQPRVYPSGNLMPPLDYFAELGKNRAPESPSGNWTFIGMNDTPSNAIEWSGVGRANCVRFDPNNTSIIYAGSPGGGLWKSTNSGTTWTILNTDGLGSLGVTDIAIDPTNSQVIYIASGSRDDDGLPGSYGLGILKSTDGGTTWNATGLNWSVSLGRTTNRILIDPTNTQLIHAATSFGIYRSTDGGTTFTQVSAVTSTRDMEFKPANPTIIYVTTRTNVYRSTNSGQNYSSVYSVSGADGLALAVTPANSSYVYIVATDINTYGFKGIYRSTDGGTSFNLRANTPNILGSDCAGADNAGQGWYDLCIAASPTDAENLFVGGLSIWGSADGGTTWTMAADGYGCTNNFVSWDIHDVSFLPGSGSILYVGSDAGVFRTQDGGQYWETMDNGLAVTQHYSLGLSQTNSSLILTCSQDIGTQLLNGTPWTQLEGGGEASKVFIDRTNDNTMYGGSYNGWYMRSTDGGANWVDINSGFTGYAQWVAPFKQDLGASATLWGGYQEIFKSTDQGTTWTQSSSLGGSESFTAIDLAPSNTQVIYAASATVMIRSIDGGASWQIITGNLPISSAQLTEIEVDPTNENHVWVTFSGYSATNKVWVTSNGGTSWSNYSTGLPNVPVNCIIYENNSPNGTLYAGTDLGVYSRNNLMSAWTSFKTGLPNAIVDELQIQYSVAKIRAATYGRGIWESDLADISLGTSILNIDDQVTIYPNPSKGIFTIKAEKFKIKNIEVFNMLGEHIYPSCLISHSSMRVAGSEGIDLSTQPNGIYFIHIFCDEGIVVKKITINK